MHASIQQLLSLRDGEPVTADTAHHVSRCADCSAEASRLVAISERLRALPVRAREPHEVDASWRRLQQASATPASASSPNKYLAIAAAVVWAAVGIVWFVLADRTAYEAHVADAQPAMPPVVQSLVVQSQALEGVLLGLPRRPRVELAATAATLDALEMRIQWLDYTLSRGADTGIAQETAALLWQERVELLDSLVTLRYAQAGRNSF